MVESAREVGGSVRVGGKNPKKVQWNDEIKDSFMKKGGCWQLVMKRQKKGALRHTEEKRKVKRCIYQSKKKVN